MYRLKIISVLSTLILIFTSFNFPENQGQNVVIFKLFNTNINKYCSIVELVNVTSKKKFKSSWMFYNGFTAAHKLPEGIYYISKAYYIAGSYSNGFKFPPESITFEVTNQGLRYFGEYKISADGIIPVSKDNEIKNLELLSQLFNIEQKGLGWKFNEEANYNSFK